MDPWTRNVGVDIKHLAFFGNDALNDIRCGTCSAIGKGNIGSDQFQRCDFACAKRNGQIIRQFGLDAHLVGCFHHLRWSNLKG